MILKISLHMSSVFLSASRKNTIIKEREGEKHFEVTNAAHISIMIVDYYDF